MARSRLTFRPTGDAAPAAPRARAVPTVFFLVWLAIPTAILVAALRDFAHDLRTWRWPATACTILESGVEEREGRGGPARAPDYAFAVRYRYRSPVARADDVESGGSADVTSTVFARGYKGDDDYAKAQRLALRYPAGSQSTCYINPAGSRESVLKRNTPWKLLLLAIPVAFIAIGVGGLYATWRPAPADASKAARPLSSSGAASNAGSKFAFVFFSLFLLFGVVMTATLAGQAVDCLTAGGWPRTPGTVVASRLREHPGDNGTTYSVDILYAYEVGGREYRSNRYAPFNGAGSGVRRKMEVLDRYPPGSPVTVYVNPRDPTEAVLQPRLTAEALVLLAPSLFAVIGVVGLYYSTRHLRRRLNDARPHEPARDEPRPRRMFEPGRRVDLQRPAPAHVARAAPGIPGGVELRPQTSPVVKLVVLLVFAAFWNGIVSAFVYQVASGWASGRVEVCLSVFLIPFVAVGVALLVGVGHTALTLFNPRVTLTLSRAELPLGGSEEIRWAFTGRYDRIHRLVIRLKGQEEATYRRGTSTCTDRNVFFTADVVDTTHPLEIHLGRATLSVPIHSMHSFESPNNKIVWTVELYGHIAGWPDVKEEYGLKVTPLPVDETSDAPESEPRSEREGAWTRG